MWFDAAAPIEVKWAGVSAIVLFAIGATLPFLLRHLQPRRFRQRPFVLFLRRFSTFSDRSVMNELLRRCPSGKPLVFLVPTRSAARDWNPFQIGFAGLRLLRPVRSLPVAVSATDAAWKAAAKELVAAAETIILDGSFGSDSIAYEVDMLQTLGAADKTVVLMLAKDGENAVDRPAASLRQTATFITYRKSWLRALPRLFLGIPASAFPAAYLSAVPGALWLGALFALRQMGVPVTDDLLGFLGRPTSTLVLVGAMTLWVYWVLFLRPAIDGRTGRHLAERLRSNGKDHDVRLERD